MEMDELKLSPEKMAKLEEWCKKNVNCVVPDNLRLDCFFPKLECRGCPKGYIIPEPTPQELLVKAQQTKIEEQSQAINTLTESMKMLTEHLATLTTAFNKIVKE